MKKILPVAMIFLVVLSTFSILAPQVKAQDQAFKVLWRFLIGKKAFGGRGLGTGDVDGDGKDDVVAIPHMNRKREQVTLYVMVVMV